MSVQNLTPTGDALAMLVAEMRRVTAQATDPRAILKQVIPAVRRMALDKSWVRPEFYRGDGDQSNISTLLHEEADHSLAVYAVAWLPGRGVPPHDHQTWAIVVGVDGPETNVFWERTDDRSEPGRCALKETYRRVFGIGEAVAFLPDDIHSVQNDSNKISLALHVYGRNLNHTGRSQFDLDTGEIRPFLIKAG